MNFLISSSISLELVLIDFVAILRLALVEATEFVFVIVFRIEALDFNSILEASFSSFPNPNPIPLSVPDVAPCLVACLSWTASLFRLSAPACIAPKVVP